MAHLPQLDSDERGNAHLQRLVHCLHQSDVSPFVEKLTKQSLGERFHSYRELLLGAQIRQGGADFRYEQNIDGQTPDWSLVEDGRLVELIDVVTIHQRNEKKREITTSVSASSRWDGWATIPPDHIYQKLTAKAGQYSALVRRVQVPYVLAVFGEFLASISPEEVSHVLLDQSSGPSAKTIGSAMSWSCTCGILCCVSSLPGRSQASPILIARVLVR
jgi:hypothetical protein